MQTTAPRDIETTQRHLDTMLKPDICDDSSLRHGDWGPRRQFQSVGLPVESAHSPFGHTVKGGVFESQRGAISLCATDSLIKNVCLLVITITGSVHDGVSWVDRGGGGGGGEPPTLLASLHNVHMWGFF